MTLDKEAMRAEVVRTLAIYRRGSASRRELDYGHARTACDWAQVALSAAEATGAAYAACQTGDDYRAVQALYYAMIRRYGRHSAYGHRCEHSTHAN